MTVIRYEPHQLHAMSGVDEEWLTDADGNIIARFYNGNIMGVPPKQGNTEPTVVIGKDDSCKQGE
jgi:hypothetical protein